VSRFQSDRPTTLPRPHAANPPEDHGERLATFPRGPGQEVRVTLDDYEGHAYVGVRLWQNGWPTQKGLSIRIHELDELAEVLARVARESGRRTARRASTTSRPTGPGSP
jgi:hypothetical protein